MVRTHLILFIVLGLGFGAVSFASPAAVHVSPAGSDAGPGTRQRPWKSLEYAVHHVPANAVVQVHAGVYRETVDLSGGGLILEAADGERVVVDGRKGDGFDIKPGVSSISLKGFHLENCMWAVSLQGGNKHIILDGLEASRSENGIHMTQGERGAPEHGGVDDVTISNCSIHHCQYSGIDATPGPARNISVRHSHIFNNGREAGYGGDGIAVEVGDRILVEDCEISDNGGDGIDLCSRNASPCEGIAVRRCRLLNNGENGIKFWWGGDASNCLMAGNGSVAFVYSGRYSLVNCTVTENSRRVRDYSLVAGYDKEPSGSVPQQQLLIQNCIFKDNGPAAEPTGLYVGSGTVLTESHNIFWSREDEEVFLAGRNPESASRENINAGRWPSGHDTHQASRGVDPRLDAQFHPLPDSPARGTGNSDIDIGAFQHDR